MIPNKKISIAFIALNVVGVLSSLFYGMKGGSGGETTEGVYLGLFYTNLASVLFGAVVAIVKFSWWRSNFIWAILVLLMYYPVTSVVLTNKINNIKNKDPKSIDFGIVQSQKYIVDKNQVEIYLQKERKINYSVDTLLYSKSLSRILIIGCVKDSSELYKNLELFATVKDNVLSINSPKGGNLLSEDTSKQTLLKKVIKWYVNTYSTNEEDVNGLWHYQDFWQ